MTRTAAGFKAKHDPATVIANLSSELKTAKEAELTAAAVRDFLGTAKLETEKLDVPKWVYEPKASSEAPGVPNLLLSDFHWGERVFKSQVNGVNEFNLDIATQRLKNVVSTTGHLLKILDPKMRYPGIVVKLGGDMIGGDIHEELATTNEEAIMPTWLHLFQNLTAALGSLADTYKNVFVPCVSGNHDRATKKTQAKNRNATSFGWLLYQMLANHFATDKRFTFYIPDSSDALYRVYNTRMLLDARRSVPWRRRHHRTHRPADARKPKEAAAQCRCGSAVRHHGVRPLAPAHHPVALDREQLPEGL